MDAHALALDLKCAILHFDTNNNDALDVKFNFIFRQKWKINYISDIGLNENSSISLPWKFTNQQNNIT